MSGVTDALLNGAHTAAGGDAQYLQSDCAGSARQALQGVGRSGQAAGTCRRVARATVEVYLGEFESLCHAVNVLGEASPRALDAISSLGERMSIQLIAAYLKSIGIGGGADRVF